MKVFLVIAIINGFLAVALGAFGAHGLEGKISASMLVIWEKAVQYQMFHASALLVTGLLLIKAQITQLNWAGIFFTIGIILFSGSLYAYSTTSVKFLAMITPFGGVCFLIGWVMLLVGVLKI